jgi:predicted RNase H-like HicB family nuclease
MTAKRDKIVFTIPIVIEPDDGEFHAYSPLLKGLHVGGETEEEALKNAKDAAVAYLISLIKHGDPIPIGIIHTEKPSLKEFIGFKSHLSKHRVDLIKVAV